MRIFRIAMSRQTCAPTANRVSLQWAKRTAFLRAMTTRISCAFNGLAIFGALTAAVLPVSEYSLLAAGRRARRGGLALTFSVCAIAARLSGSHDASASIASALIDAHRDALHAGNADGGLQ